MASDEEVYHKKIREVLDENTKNRECSISILKETICRTETHYGKTEKTCQLIIRVFRNCPGRPAEELETRRETIAGAEPEKAFSSSFPSSFPSSLPSVDLSSLQPVDELKQRIIGKVLDSVVPVVGEAMGRWFDEQLDGLRGWASSKTANNASNKTKISAKPPHAIVSKYQDA